MEDLNQFLASYPTSASPSHALHPQEAGTEPTETYLMDPCYTNYGPSPQTYLSDRGGPFDGARAQPTAYFHSVQPRTSYPEAYTFDNIQGYYDDAEISRSCERRSAGRNRFSPYARTPLASQHVRISRRRPDPLDLSGATRYTDAVSGMSYPAMNGYGIPLTPSPTTSAYSMTASSSGSSYGYPVTPQFGSSPYLSLVQGKDQVQLATYPMGIPQTAASLTADDILSFVDMPDGVGEAMNQGESQWNLPLQQVQQAGGTSATSPTLVTGYTVDSEVGIGNRFDLGTAETTISAALYPNNYKFENEEHQEGSLEQYIPKGLQESGTGPDTLQSIQQSEKTKEQEEQAMPLPVVEKQRHYCDVDGCDKSYARIYDLRRHKNNHDGLMFACRFCGKEYRRRDVAVKHERESCKRAPRS